MTRSFFAAIVVGAAVMASVPGYLQGCTQTGVGDPCTPEQEYDPTFAGFSYEEVNVESKSFDCQTRLCLANHFEGRVTCPYGQSATGGAPGDGMVYSDPNGKPIGACVLPGGGDDLANGSAPSVGGVSQAVVGSLGPDAGPNATALVPPQCTDRTASDTVYCSCRCANVSGQTNDGADYCSCPDGYTCQQLVTSIGTTNEGLTGAYCIKSKTQYSSLGVCAEQCVPSGKNCGSFNGQ